MVEIIPHFIKHPLSNISPSNKPYYEFKKNAAHLGSDLDGINMQEELLYKLYNQHNEVHANYTNK